MMEERRLGPVVGLGTWNTFDTDAALASEVLDAALAAGTRLIDSSPMYRGAEQALGRALDGRREEVVVATKIWASSLEEGRDQFRRQLEWYGHVEVEQVHNLLAWQAHVEWLETERDAGHIGRLGVTHYQASAFDELADALETGRFQVLQVPYSPWERECERRLLPLADELGVAVIAMRPLGGSGADGRRRIEPTPAELAELGVYSWAEALLRWALADRRVDCVIPATSRPERAVENACAGDGTGFSDEQRALVERLAGRLPPA
jgi:diketogulonate reductase-like aldo/keto reductase